MTFTSGTRLGPYEIVALIGAGGMGEVYRARDTRLDRRVAIKVLNSSLVASPELRQRFEREARTISRLNHPHICTLHDVGRHDGTDFLVMEYLEGETLAQRLSKGALGLADLLKVGIAILDGLEQAHRAGIVHRDLKPGNVMLTKAGAKLLDFGLAKPALASASAGTASPPLFSAVMTASSPSPQSPLTSSGTMVGTVQYMSPEQFEGKESDARSDIFSFGAMLYEMATGDRAFAGKTQIKVVSAILEDNPAPVSQVHPGLPAAIDHVVQTCLQKLPDDRYRSAHDIAVELKWISQTAKVPSAQQQPISKWIAAGLLLGVLLGGLAVHFLSTTQPVRPVALAILPSPGVTFNFSGLYGPPAISPDGTRVVVVGSDSTGTRMLSLRSLDNTTLMPLSGTAGASYPFWSPDGKQIGFFTSNALKIVDVAGRSVLDLCAIEEGRGGAWNDRGEIVFGSRTTGLFRVPASGGTPVALTKVGSREANHRFPTFLPDGKHVAYVVQSPGSAKVQVVSLDDSRPVGLPAIVSNVAFSQGRIFHVRADGSLLAQRFDPNRLSLEPNLELVAKPVGFDGQFNYAAFSVAPQGTIAYEEGSGSTANELVWVDPAGKQVGKLPTLITDTSGAGLRISPRGDQLLYIGSGATRSDIWVVQLSRGTRTRISLGSAGGVFGIWSPDSRRVAYQNGVGGDSIVVRTSDGLGGEQVVVKMQGDVLPRSWSADGNYIVFEYHATAPNSPGEIWVAPLKPGEAPHPLVHNISSFGTDLSPDGKWLAYTSEESGRMEVYVIPFEPSALPANAVASGRWQVSTEGGNQPRWSHTGTELFFPNPSGTTLYATSIKAEAGKFESSDVRKLFDLPLHPAWAFYDVGRDGSIYMFRYVGRQTSPLTVLMNWRPSGK